LLRRLRKIGTVPDRFRIVSWQHLQTFLWLRWRLLVNQWRRAGALNAVLMMIFTFGAVAIVVPLSIGCFVLGLYVIPMAAPDHLMYAWDGLILAFLFFWGIGLVTELQRTEPLALSQFLHLPVSVKGAYLINYVSSLLRLSLIFFGPVMLAFGLALVYVKGILFLPVLLSLAGLVLLVTALTYQFQGWLAALMSNPRRRRAVIVGTTAAIVLLAQLPNLLNFLTPWGAFAGKDKAAALALESAKLKNAHRDGEIDDKELERRQQELVQKGLNSTRQQLEQWKQAARLANMALPVGWLPYGVMAAAEGRVLPSILGFLGMALLGSASLWRAYRTTMGLYQGQTTNRPARPAPAATEAAPVRNRRRSSLMLEARLPGISEPVAAIALAGFRALVRSPEAKMMLLTPLIMIPIFGSMLWRARDRMPELTRPLVAIAGMALVLLGVLQVMGNQFAFDRDGFRVYVLSAARRRDILLGKNLVFVPVVLGMTALLLLILEVVSPMRLDHLLAMLPQCISMFLLFCILTNLISIYAPFYVAAGSLKPSNPKLTTVLLQLVMIFFLFPLIQGLTLLPLGIEALLRLFGFSAAAPICLMLTSAQCALVVLVYHFVLVWEGGLLQAREQRILEIVTSHAL
jgi:hypothetical protein